MKNKHRQAKKKLSGQYNNQKEEEITHMEENNKRCCREQRESPVKNDRIQKETKTLAAMTWDLRLVNIQTKGGHETLRTHTRLMRCRWKQLGRADNYKGTQRQDVETEDKIFLQTGKPRVMKIQTLI